MSHLRSRAAVVVFALAALAGSSGCMVSRATGRALGSLFASPRKVDKPDDPVQKGARLAVTWVGHATALVQMDDKFILTDPVFTSTVGQLSKRLVEPGIDPDKLPPLDAVLVSHMHFDHLSLGSLAEIEERVKTLLMPEGGVSYLTNFPFQAIELRTWQAWEKDGLRVTAVPVDHVGFRYGIDDAWMTHAFTGYVVEYHGLKVYFAGDTAYDARAFLETAQRLPEIDLALLPIAPIEPRDFMRRIHMDPREAVQCFFDLGARWMVPIHYGTFINSTDHQGDALRLLNEAVKGARLGARQVVPLAIGSPRVFLKAGEEHAALPVDEPPPAPAAPEPPKEEPKKDGIPDDDKLD